MDGFKIAPGNGRSATSLSYGQSLRVLSLGLRYLLLSAVNTHGAVVIDPSEPNFQAGELLLLMQIASRGPINESHRTVLDEKIEKAIDLIERAYPVDEAAMTLVRNYVSLLARNYPIIVSLPNTKSQLRRRLVFERLIMLSNPPRLRLLFGLRPNYTEIPIGLAFNTDSYHLEVSGPTDYYVSRQFIGCTKCNKRLRWDWRCPEILSRQPASGQPVHASKPCSHVPIGLDDQCYLRVRRRLGQDYAHIYMRGFSQSNLNSGNMSARIQFSEAPPGVEERALVSAVTASIALGVVGYILHKNSSNLPTDVSSILLALPGLAAAWFGFSAEADTVPTFVSRCPGVTLCYWHTIPCWSGLLPH